MIQSQFLVPGGLHEDLRILPDLAPRVEARDRAVAIRCETLRGLHLGGASEIMEVLARKHDISGLGLGVFLGENGWADGSFDLPEGLGIWFSGRLALVPEGDHVLGRGRVDIWGFFSGELDQEQAVIGALAGKLAPLQEICSS